MLDIGKASLACPCVHEEVLQNYCLFEQVLEHFSFVVKALRLVAVQDHELISVKSLQATVDVIARTSRCIITGLTCTDLLQQELSRVLFLNHLVENDPLTVPFELNPLKKVTETVQLQL